MQAVTEFMAQRGVRPNPNKSYIASVTEGFDYLGRHYQRRDGVLKVSASVNKTIEIEYTLRALILDFKGTIRALIDAVNYELTKLYRNHRAEDAYMLFRHIDSFVTGLFIKRMCAKRTRWHRETILEHFFVRDNDRYIFVLPSDRTVRVIQLAPRAIKKHTPCKPDFNPFLDKEYYAALQYQREVQKTNGNFRAIWNRQNGRCAYCGQPMLPDQDVEIVEKILGRGHRIRNLSYIHKKCSYDTSPKTGDVIGLPVDLAELLHDMLDDAPEMETLGRITIDPYKSEIQKDGVPLELTQREYDILIYLFSQLGKVFSREDLLHQVWDYPGYIGSVRGVDVAIRRLREKIEDDPAHPDIILTRRGLGYLLNM